MTSDAWLPPEPGNVRLNEERSVDIAVDSDQAEEFAETAGVDPTQDEIAEYVEMQRHIEPPD